MSDWDTHAGVIGGEFQTRVVDVALSAPPTGLGFDLPTHYDNIENAEPDAAAPWARHSILWGESIQQSMGAQSASGNRERTIGIASILIFVPLEEGDEEVLETFRFISDKFRRLSVSGIQFRTATIGGAIPSRNGRWWQLNVQLPFYVDDVKPNAT